MLELKLLENDVCNLCPPDNCNPDYVGPYCPPDDGQCSPDLSGPSCTPDL